MYSDILLHKGTLKLVMFASLVLSALLIPQCIYSSSATLKSNTDPPIVVCTTTVLASIVNDIANGKVVVEVIASPAVCPGHYDVKPSDVEAFKQADLILMHGFEPWVKDLKQASGSQAPVVKIPGPWNTPEMLKSRYSAVAKAMKEKLGIDVSSKLEKCLLAIDSIEEQLKKYSEENRFKGEPVVCMLWQKDFVECLGFKVAAVYGPPEKVSAKEYGNIIKNATEAHISLVIDNLQSGTELGEKIASETGAVEVAISNFPGVAPNLYNVTSMMKWNVAKLAEALKNSRAMGETVQLRDQIDVWRTTTTVTSIVSVVELLLIVLLVTRLKKR